MLFGVVRSILVQRHRRPGRFHARRLYGQGGRAFIATHSTTIDKATGERVSKIVPQLKRGATVTLTRTDVMYVATEYGVVNLKGKSLRERARALISIAHPDFRPELISYARGVKYFVFPEHEKIG